MTEKLKPLFVAGILIALQDVSFCNDYDKLTSFNSLLNACCSAIENVLNSGEIEEKKIKEIKGRFKDIGGIIKLRDTPLNEDNSLRWYINQLEMKIKPMMDYVGNTIDALGVFYHEFMADECKYKFIAFGRELNTHIKKDFSVYLPVCYETSKDGNRIPKLDNKYIYSDDGYIPDFEFMENYIKSLHSKPVTTKVHKNNNRLEINTKADQTDGNTPYIGATDSNNGLANVLPASAILGDR